MKLTRFLKKILTVLTATLCLFIFQNCGTKPFVKPTGLGQIDLRSTADSADQIIPPVAPVVTPQPVLDGSKLITDSIFAPTSFWYTPIPADAPLHANTANMLTDFIRQKNFYPAVGVNTTSYTSPVFYVDANTPAVKVTQWDCQSMAS